MPRHGNSEGVSDRSATSIAFARAKAATRSGAGGRSLAGAAGRRGRHIRRVRRRADQLITLLMHTRAVSSGAGAGALGVQEPGPAARFARAVSGRAGAGADHGSAGAAAAAQPHRPDRGQRPLWRAHVARGLAHRRGADGLVQRRWRLRGHGGGLRPARLGHRLLGRAEFPAAPQRSARAGGLRRGGGHRRRLQRPALRRVLRHRAGHRRLFHRHLALRRARRLGRHAHRADPGLCLAAAQRGAAAERAA